MSDKPVSNQISEKGKSSSKNKVAGRIGTALIIVGVVFILYYCWLNYFGTLYQNISYFFYERRLEKYGDEVQDNDDFFTYDNLPRFLFTGQDLIDSDHSPVSGLEEFEIEEPTGGEESDGTAEWMTGPVDYIERSAYKDNNMVLIVPRMGVKTGIISGVSTNQLKRGPGLYQQSDLPGEDGTVVIAAHRDVYGAWFYNIDKLKSGDRMRLKFNGMTYVYEFESLEIVESNDWSAVEKKEYGALILTSCTPIGTSEKRIIAVGRLIDTVAQE